MKNTTSRVKADKEEWMRVVIDFDNDIGKIPFQKIGTLNHAISSWFYGSFFQNGAYTKKVHDEGKVIGNRRVKPFVFAAYQGKTGMRVKLASVDGEFLANTLGALNMQAAFEYEGKKYRPRSIRVATKQALRFEAAGTDGELAKASLFCLSPIVLRTKDGKYAVMAEDGNNEEIDRMIMDNATRKYEAVSGKKLEKPWLKVWFHHPVTGKTQFKGYKTEFTMSRMTVITNPELLHVIHNNGMGCKNGMGFGMVEIQNKVNYKKMKKQEATV